MSQAGQRRLRKDARTLSKLAISSPAAFQREWARLLTCWQKEAQRRGRCLRNDINCEHTQEKVFGVLDKAEQLLMLCGEIVQRMVGRRTRELLTHECAKAYALAVSPNLYKLNNHQHNKWLMETGYRPPR